MPYTPDSPDLPENVKKMSDKDRRQWCHIWNSAYDSCMADSGDQKSCETKAFKEANGVLKKDSIVDAARHLWVALGSIFDPVERKWSGAASNYSDTESYCSACLIDLNPAGKEKVQDMCKLPVKSPGSSEYNYEGIQAAAAALSGARNKMVKPSDVSEEDWNSALKKAANTIISQYNANGDTAPEGVYEVAGKTSPDKKQSISLGDLFGTIAYTLQDSPTGFSWLLDLYTEPTGEIFAVAAREGKLYKIPVTFQGDYPILGLETEVVYDFRPPLSQNITIHRQKNGRARWFLSAGSTVLNRNAEIDSRRLFDRFTERAYSTGNFPYATFFHLGEKMRMGSVDFIARDENILVMSGLFDEDSELADLMIKAVEREPDYWGSSVSFFPFEWENLVIQSIPDIKIPVYTDGELREVSFLPEKDACALFTGLTVQREVRMRKEAEDAILRLCDGNEDLARKFIAKIDASNRSINDLGLITQSVSTVSPDPEPDVVIAVTESAQESEQVQEPVTPVKVEVPVKEQNIEDNFGSAEIKELRMLVEQQAVQIATLTASVQTLTASVTSNVAAGAELKGRFDRLEAEDADKRRTFTNDLPRNGQNSQVEIVRPRKQSISKQSISRQAIAEETLSHLK